MLLLCFEFQTTFVSSAVMSDFLIAGDFLFVVRRLYAHNLTEKLQCSEVVVQRHCYGDAHVRCDIYFVVFATNHTAV